MMKTTFTLTRNPGLHNHSFLKTRSNFKRPVHLERSFCKGLLCSWGKNHFHPLHRYPVSPFLKQSVLHKNTNACFQQSKADLGSIFTKKVFVEKVNLFCKKHSVKDLSLKVDIVRISHSDKVNWTLKNTLPWEKRYFQIMKVC